jgi:hypothetical protein
VVPMPSFVYELPWVPHPGRDHLLLVDHERFNGFCRDLDAALLVRRPDGVRMVCLVRDAVTTAVPHEVRRGDHQPQWLGWGERQTRPSQTLSWELDLGLFREVDERPIVTPPSTIAPLSQPV